jgi:DNA polymerase III subunit beta
VDNVKFRCDRDALSEALQTVQRGVSSRPGIPALTGVLIEAASEGALTLTTTDLEVSARLSIDVQVGEPGISLVPARLLADTVKSLSDAPVEFETDQSQARIRCAAYEGSLRLLPAEDFPALQPPSGTRIVAEAPRFAEAVGQVARAASRDEARPVLTGILLEVSREGVTLVATDSYRLAVRDLDGAHVVEEDHRVLVPARALTELLRVPASQDVTVILADREAQFVAGATKVTTRLIEGDFPNYRQLLPSGYPNHLTLSKERFVEAVRRVRLVAQGRDNTPVKLVLNADGVELTASAQDIGRAYEALEAKYEGTEMTVAFNPEFLVDGLTAVEGSEVVLETLDGLKPATIQAHEQANFTYLLMPVRIP